MPSIASQNTQVILIRLQLSTALCWWEFVILFFHRPWMSWISNVSGWQLYQLHATPQLNSLKWPTEKESERFVTLFLTSGQWLSRNGECKNKTTSLSVIHCIIRVLTYEYRLPAIIILIQQQDNLKVNYTQRCVRRNIVPINLQQHSTCWRKSFKTFSSLNWYTTGGCWY